MRSILCGLAAALAIGGPASLVDQEPSLVVRAVRRRLLVASSLPSDRFGQFRIDFDRLFAGCLGLLDVFLVLFEIHEEERVAIR